MTSKPSSTNCPNFSLCEKTCQRSSLKERPKVVGNAQIVLWLFVNHTARATLYDIQVAIVAGFHLFPFRTEKLSPSTPMVLRKWESRSLPSFRRAEESILGSPFILWRPPLVQYRLPCLSSAYAERGKWESRSLPHLFSLLRKRAPFSRLLASGQVTAHIAVTYSEFADFVMCNWGQSPFAHQNLLKVSQR